MSLVALGTAPLVYVGGANRNLVPSIASLGSTTLDAANEACFMVGYVITEDGASHTIDTTGSSSLGWRTGAVTFANAGTTVKVGLAAVDTAAGPSVRPANASDVVTFDVSKSLTGGGGGITANAWQEHVPGAGSKTIANGDLVAFVVQMTARGGAADSIIVSCAPSLVNNNLPAVTSFTGGSYADSGRIPNAVITFSDGALGFFYGGFVASVGSTTQTWNNTSGTKEYGNFIQLPVPANAYGIRLSANLAGNADVILYSSPLGTPAVEKSVSVDLNTIAVANNTSILEVLFPTPFSLAANTPYAVILKPTSATSVSMLYKTVNATAHLKAETLGLNCYAINRNAGAFAAQNSSKDLFPIGLLVGAFDAGGSTGRSIQVNNPSLVA